MSGPRLVSAHCAGRAVKVPVRPSPPDHRRVPCPTCGVTRGRECLDLTAPGVTLWSGHAARKSAAERLYGVA